MTRDDIIRLAQEAGGGLESEYTNISALERFAALVAAAEQTEFKQMVEKGTKAWADTPDNWVDELRND